MKEWLGNGLGGGLIAFGLIVSILSFIARIYVRRSPRPHRTYETTVGMTAGLLLIVLGLFAYFIALTGRF